MTIPPMNENKAIIEDYFPKEIRSIKINGLGFDFKKEKNEEKSHGKHIFTEKVIKPMSKANKIDFSNFKKIFNIMEYILKDFGKRKLD